MHHGSLEQLSRLARREIQGPGMRTDRMDAGNTPPLPYTANINRLPPR